MRREVEFMRIISGEFRHRHLHSPPADTTRPITDRAKQSLFDSLQDCFAVDEGSGAGTVLDCFAGTGSMGLECLSRGAAKAVFVEQGHGALAMLKKNIEELGVQERAVVLGMDAYACAEHPDVRNLTVAFVDPPYVHMEDGFTRAKVDALVRSLAEKCMVEGGIISLRHHGRVSVDGPAMGVKVVREFKYGDMTITWVRKG